jgi:hypothetical protein
MFLRPIKGKPVAMLGRKASGPLAKGDSGVARTKCLLSTLKGS